MIERPAFGYQLVPLGLGVGIFSGIGPGGKQSSIEGDIGQGFAVVLIRIITDTA
jgi:hypothetical protein